MAEETRRVRLKIGDAEIEIEGDEKFVNEKLAYFEEKILPMLAEGMATRPGAAIARGEAIPSLSDYIGTRNLPSHMAKVTAMALYLIREKGMEEISAAEVEPCYSELGIRKPASIDQTLRNAKNKKQWLREGSKPGYFRLSVPGENMVLYDSLKKD